MTQPARYRPAIDLLKELGITEPSEIDIEAIAQHCGATVTYGRLSGSEGSPTDGCLVRKHESSVRTSAQSSLSRFTPAPKHGDLRQTNVSSFRLVTTIVKGHPWIKFLGRQTAQDQVGQLHRRLFGHIEAVLKQQRIHVGLQDEIDRVHRLVQRGLALELA